jgi:putative transcriptional regulator
MPIVYKINVLQALKDAGYNTNKIRKEKIMGEAMLQKLRQGQMVSWATFETICSLLDCQPADLIEYQKEGDVSGKAD